MNKITELKLKAFIKQELEPEGMEEIRQRLKSSPSLQNRLHELEQLLERLELLKQLNPHQEDSVIDKVMCSIETLDVSKVVHKGDRMLLSSKKTHVRAETQELLASHCSNRKAWAFVLVGIVAAFMACLAYLFLRENPFGSVSTSYPSAFHEKGYNDSIGRILVGETFALIEGAVGALLMLFCLVLAFLSLVVAKKGRRLIWFGPLFSCACGLFAMRSLVSLFFGSDFDNSGYSIIERSGSPRASSFSLHDSESKPASDSSLGKAYIGETNPPAHSKTDLSISSLANPISEQDGSTPPTLSREDYRHQALNPFLDPQNNPLSTFSIDVDTASMTNIRRYLLSNKLPPKGAVRIEEMINYFSYNYPDPEDDEIIAVHSEILSAPWNKHHRLLRIAIKGRSQSSEDIPPANFVFLIDVSGSMEEELPLVIAGLNMLVDRLRPQDQVGIVTYAASEREVIPPTTGRNKERIKTALSQLHSGGSTNGAGGITRAYESARASFIRGGNNRVILVTDGDFNVGLSSESELVEMIERERESGVFLTVIGTGSGNYQDAKMEKLADKGNGNFAFIDTAREAKKVLADEFSGALYTVAKDVKVQIEFNPEHVQAYRLIGYENRVLAKEDFNNDKVDAGEMGAGQTVTALYEIVPPGIEFERSSVDSLRYQQSNSIPRNAHGSVTADELAIVKLRYKTLEQMGSVRREFPIRALLSPKSEEAISSDSRFAAAVAEFGLLLREDPNRGSASYESVIAEARRCFTTDETGYRAEFVGLVEQAQALSAR